MRLEIAVVETQLRSIDDLCSQRFSYGNDIGDQANDLVERTRNLTLRSYWENRLQQLNDALACLTRGKDGICDMCGNSIDSARLEIIPEATLCVACQRRRERTIASGKLAKSCRHV